MPKYLWRPYMRSVKSLSEYKKSERRLLELTGLNLENLVRALEEGYTLQPPEMTEKQKRLIESMIDNDPHIFDRTYPISADEIKRLSEEYRLEPTITTDENGQMRFMEG